MANNSTYVEGRLTYKFPNCSLMHFYILDLGDITLQDIFSRKELIGIQEYGKTTIVHTANENISTELSEMEEMVREA